MTFSLSLESFPNSQEEYYFFNRKYDPLVAELNKEKVRIGIRMLNDGKKDVEINLSNNSNLSSLYKQKEQEEKKIKSQKRKLDFNMKFNEKVKRQRHDIFVIPDDYYWWM